MGTRARHGWDDRLQDLFATPVFQGDVKEEGDPMFWSPLIALHDGGREEEILQLSPDDFHTQNGSHYMNIHNDDGNNLKTFSSIRSIPVHPALSELGLIKLVELRRRQGHTRLFPFINRGKSKQRFSENFTKNFNYYRRIHNVYWQGLDFHSFRTTFHGQLMNNECTDAMRRRLMGHAMVDEGEKSYSQNLAIKALFKPINRVWYDLSKVKSPFGQPATSASQRAEAVGIRRIK